MQNALIAARSLAQLLAVPELDILDSLETYRVAQCTLAMYKESLQDYRDVAEAWVQDGMRSEICGEGWGLFVAG